jgi:AbrB family looped-hinge helix DNA binding protein
MGNIQYPQMEFRLRISVDRREETMDATIEVARRGQITIPKHLRDDLGIEEGQKYVIRTLEGGVLVLIPQNGKAVAALGKLRKALVAKGASSEELRTELRRKREGTKMP